MCGLVWTGRSRGDHDGRTRSNGHPSSHRVVPRRSALEPPCLCRWPVLFDPPSAASLWMVLTMQDRPTFGAYLHASTQRPRFCTLPRPPERTTTIVNCNQEGSGNVPWRKQRSIVRHSCTNITLWVTRGKEEKALKQSFISSVDTNCLSYVCEFLWRLRFELGHRPRKRWKVAESGR